MTTKQKIESLIKFVKASDFSKVSCDLNSVCTDEEIIDSLVEFLWYNPKNSPKSYPLIEKLSHLSEGDKIPLLPLQELNMLGTSLSFIKKHDAKIYDSYKNILASRKARADQIYYESRLFELYVGCILVLNETKLEFFEITSKKKGAPDFKIDANDNIGRIWIEIYKNYSDEITKKFWGDGMTRHSSEEIEVMKRAFVSRLCKSIRRKRKNIPADDVFITVVRTRERLFSRNTNYQALVNDFPSKSCLIVFTTGPYLTFTAGGHSSGEDVEIYFNEDGSFSDSSKECIAKAFKISYLLESTS